MLRKVIAAVMLTGLAACANTTGGGEDRLSRSYVEQHLTVGRSTQADVRALYGEPAYKNESTSDDYWRYSEDQINPDYLSKALNLLPSMGMVGDAAAQTQGRKTSRDLHFHFNRKGVLESFSVNGSTGADR